MADPIRGSRLRRAMEQSLPCDSLLQESTSSVLPFSEPPDIRKWYSSYVYESPVLNSIDAFEDANKKEDNIDNNIVPDSLQSELQLSGFSEAPDIRKWYSSYVYESPELSCDLRENITEESLHIKETAADEKNSKDQELKAAMNPCNDVGGGETIWSDRLLIAPTFLVIKEHHPQSLSKIADSSGSFSQFSEAHHISNWYSSYVYESPELKIPDDSPQPSFNEKESRQHGSILEEPNRDNIGKTSACKRLPLNQDNNKLKLIELISGEDQKGRVFTDHDKNLLLGSCFKSSSDSSKETEQTFGGEQHKTVPNSLMFNEPYRRPTTFEGPDKKNEGGGIDSSGFVSIRKKRANDENPSRRPDRALRKCSNDKENALSLSMSNGNRRALSETTNLYGPSDVLGSTGKWKCPQRRKPSLGPPLKQLRLEKWVHFVRE